MVLDTCRRALLHNDATTLSGLDVGGANDFEMSKLNQRIREFLEDTSQDHRSKNCFAWGKLRIQLDPDSPIKGVEFQERVYVSIYDPRTDTMLQFSVPVESVEFEENALSEQND